MDANSQQTNFTDFNLNEHLFQAISDLGYTSATPIQAQTIPLLLDYQDVIGQAQTGTGKTAAFALPILTQIDVHSPHLQAIVLAPTRELAIQVSDSFIELAKHMPSFRICTIYGGQSYQIQMRQLRNAPSVIVGTPGRIIDHIEKGTLNLSHIKHVVLDEADEMLKMGFIDDVDLILSHTPKERQTVLFSATMPKPIQNIAKKHQTNPTLIKIQAKTETASTIDQQVIMLREAQKFDALIRILETEPTEGVIIFCRTKINTQLVADKLRDLQYASAALNGEMEQRQREHTIEALKSGRLNIVVATDVAARGLDVNRISHVINYDMPQQVDAYIHRIGRTGRAGKTGKAILFCTNGERYQLKMIERIIKKSIENMTVPTMEQVKNCQIEKIKSRILQTSESLSDKPEKTDIFSNMIKQLCQDPNLSAQSIASTLAYMLFGKKLNAIKPIEDQKTSLKNKSGKFADRERGRDGGRERTGDRDRSGRRDRTRDRSFGDRPTQDGLSQYRIEVGRAQGISPRNIVGAIANEISLDSQYIGHIKLHDTFSTVELPADLPPKALQKLERIWIAGQQLSVRRMKGGDSGTFSKSDRKTKPGKPSKRVFVNPTNKFPKKNKKRSTEFEMA